MIIESILITSLMLVVATGPATQFAPAPCTISSSLTYSPTVDDDTLTTPVQTYTGINSPVTSSLYGFTSSREVRAVYEGEPQFIPKPIETAYVYGQAWGNW